MGYPPFADLKKATGIDLDEVLDIKWKDNRLMNEIDAIAESRMVDRPLHILYQIIFWCLDHAKYELALHYWQALTDPFNPDDEDGIPIGDKTNAFVVYCLDKHMLMATIFLLEHEIHEGVPSLPLEQIEKEFGASSIKDTLSKLEKINK